MPSKEETIRATFDQQAVACERLGSSFTGALCRLLAERLTENSAVGRHVLNWPGDPSNLADSVPLRLAGALHALVLSGKDKHLTDAYPPNELDIGELWAAVSAAFEAHEAFILERLEFAPQTNEVRRSAMIVPGFMEIARLTGKPLILSEVGSSAGLNLNWDRYHYRFGDVVRGDAASPVRLQPELEGCDPTVAPISVTERRGCDINPLNPADPDHRMRMLSYIWPDQADRLERTQAAFDIAADAPPPVDRVDAVDWLRGRLDGQMAGQAHVVFSTIAWQYLPEPLRAEGAQLIELAGARASKDAPLAWLQMEADGEQGSAALTLQMWPVGEKRLLGRADFHGRWIRWQGWDVSS